MPSLNAFDLLLVMTQVAVAFAGFASLASALGDREQTRVDAGRLTNMLVVSLCTALLCLVPAVPALLGMPQGWIWRPSAAIALACMLVFTPGVVQRTRRMKKYAGFSFLTNAVTFGVAALAAVAFAAGALGLTPDPSAVYVTGLLLLLLICALVFFRVIVSLLQPHAPE